MSLTDSNTQALAVTVRSVQNECFRSIRNATRFLLASAFALVLSHWVHAAPSDARTDPYSVSIWTIGNGLPQGTINDMLQTEDGALWIATFGGLLRFDGVEFRTFDFDTLPKLPSVRITGLEHDGTQGLWVLTQGGDVLSFRDGQIDKLFAIPNPTQAVLSVVSVLRSDAGDLWFRGSSAGLWLYRNGSWSKPFGEFPQQDTFSSMCLDSDGHAVVAGDKTLIRARESGSSGRDLIAPERISALAAGGPNHLWVGLFDGLAVARADAIERVVVDPPFESRVTALLDDGAGGVWIGMVNGLVHLVRVGGTDGWIRDAGATALLETFYVQSLLEDLEGNLWVGSRGMGLARVSRGRAEVFKPSPRDTGVSAVASDGAGGAWVSFDSRNLGHASASNVGSEALTWTIENSTSVFALMRAADGALWASSDNKLTRTWNGSKTEFELPPRVGAIVETRLGEIWVSVEGGHRIVRLSKEGGVAEGFVVPERVISVAPDFGDGFWIGGEGTVLHHAGGRTERFGFDEGVPKGDVRSLLPEPDGSVWIATYGGGLAFLENGRARRVARSQGLPNMALSNIQDDGLGRLWLLSNQGLIVAGRDELKALAKDQTARFDPIVIGPAAGIPEANFGAPAGVKDERGRLWFGTIAGPVRIDPREFPFNRTPPRVHIDNVLADDVKLTVGALVEVPAATRRLVFEFTTFSLTAPERVHFRYRLDGFDDDWNDSGSERSASYTGLKPRPYTFRVEARNEDGVWSQAPATLSIEVAPSWWETNWFITAMAFVFLGSMYLLDRVRVGIIRRRARALLDATEGRARAEERESRLREELAHIGRVATAGELATSLAHEVNQPLAAIVTNAQAGRRYLARDALDKKGLDEILRDIAQQGQRASDIIQGLREFLRKHESERRPVDLNNIVRDTLPLVRRELQDHRIDLVLKLAPNVNAVDADPIQLQQVVVNLVNNACEAMSTSNGERTLELRTTNSVERVGFEVRDTGPGIAREVADRLFQPYTTTKSAGMGLGLAICRSIVEAHGGRISADSAGGPGTTFLVDLPRRAE